MQRDETNITQSGEQPKAIMLSDETLTINEALAVWLWMLNNNDEAVRAALSTRQADNAARGKLREAA